MRAEADHTSAAIAVDAQGELTQILETKPDQTKEAFSQDEAKEQVDQTQSTKVTDTHTDTSAEHAAIAAVADKNVVALLEANSDLDDEPKETLDATVTVKKMRKLWNHVDLDGDKFLSHEEVKHLVGSMERNLGMGGGYQPGKKEGEGKMDFFQERITKEFLAGMDQDGDGKVSFKDYAAFNAKMTTDPVFKAKHEQRQNDLMTEMLVEQIPELKEKLAEAKRAADLQLAKKI